MTSTPGASLASCFKLSISRAALGLIDSLGPSGTYSSSRRKHDTVQSPRCTHRWASSVPGATSLPASGGVQGWVWVECGVVFDVLCCSAVMCLV